MDDLRVAPGPATSRGKPISLTVAGRTIDCFEGETVGAALHAAGERVLMRSIKYHRPRGLFCCTGKCAGCLMRIDGTPNVRACVTPARDGMVIEHQNAFPSAGRDLFSVVDKVYRKNFDYHARFIRPRFMSPIYNGVIRRMAGYGRIPDLRPVERPPIQRLAVDVLVVGGGPAGLAAAAAAAEGAATVLLVEEADRAGGSLLFEPGGVQEADELVARAQDAGGRILERSVAFGVYLTDGEGNALAPPGKVAIMTPENVVEVRPKTLVVASGYHETPPLIVGNDLPGVMGARAGLILLHRHGVIPGRRIAFAGSGQLADRAREDLARAGCEIVDGHVSEAWGGTRLEGAIVDGKKMEIDCILCAGDETPRVELLQQSGARLAVRDRSLVPALDAGDVATSVRGVFAAGTVADPALPVSERLAMGGRAGEAAARHARGMPV